MSLSKNEFEYLRLHAKKCDHRHMAPEASFDLAADLRANKGRGGKMFEKRKQRTDKYIVDDSDHPTSALGQNFFPGPKLFAPHPVPWSAPATTSQPTHRAFMDRVNRNKDSRDEEEDSVDNLSDAERLHKLYRILGYAPPEDLMQMRPVQGPKVDLRSSARVPAVLGRDFNRNAKGWCAVDSDPQQTANPATHSQHHSGLLEVDPDYVDYYPVYTDPETQGPQLQGGNKPRPKSWHAVTMEDFAQDEEVLAGDYNPRPKAWQPVYEEDDDSPQQVLQFGDYNLKPKPWMSQESEDVNPKGEVQYGDYNPRPKAWRSKHRKGRSKTRYGDYNPRPRAWQSSEREHFHGREDSESQSEVKFGDYNPRPKAWRSPDSDQYSSRSQIRFGDYNPRPKAWKPHRSRSHGSPPKVRYGDYNARPKAWRSPPRYDSSSSSSAYSSSEYSDDDYSYASTPYSRSSVPACDV